MKRISQMCFLFLLSVLAGGAYADPLKLYVSYPSGWQQREPLVRDNMLTYEARQQVSGKTIQHLQITAFSPPSNRPSPTRESLKSLATQLRDVAQRTAKETKIAIVPFNKAEGYYFMATDKNPKAGEFTQMIEGVILNQSYLINFTLLTNDAQSADAKAMVAALDGLSIR